jgi:type IV pilus assembly protein PilP
MTRRLLLTALLLAATPAAAQQSPAPAAADAAAASPSPVAESQGFTYSPDGRRDPFVSMMRRGTESAAGPARTPGLTGLGADDISLRGVMFSRNQYVGIVQGADNKTYIVRAGQQLLDGTIRAIDKDSMVIVQRVNDPLAIEKQRELRKAIRQDEAK